MHRRDFFVVSLFISVLLAMGPVDAQEFIQYGSATTYQNAKARALYPQTWGQYGNGQRHNPVYTVPSTAPSFLLTGVSTVAPLTGDEFRRAQAAKAYFPQDGNLAWGSSAGQWIGNVVGASVVQGIVYATTSRREVYAVDAASGLAIWRKELVGTAGMGQPLVQVIGGKLRVFVPVGDADYNIHSAVRAAYGQDSNRGAEHSAVYCFDGLTGAQVWRADTSGASRPTPIYRNGLLYVVNGDGHLYTLNATTGTLVSSFTNPGEGQVGLASPNWYLTPAGRLLILYGTTSPRNILAVDVTTSTAPFLAWSYAPPGATSNSPGDTAVAVDPDAGLMLTSVFTNTGTSSAPVYDLRVIALNAATGTVAWSALAGDGPTLDGFKAGNPTIYQGAVYLGDPLNATIQSYDLLTGVRRWSTWVPSTDPAVRNAPRAAPVIAQGKLIMPVAQHIYSLDPATGVLANDFYIPYPYAAFGLNQPVVVGDIMYLSSVSGYVYLMPVDYVLSQPGPPTQTTPALPLKTAEYYDATALPTSSQTVGFPTTSLAYAGGPSHNSYVATGPTLSKKWTKGLVYALSLTGTPLDSGLYGTEVAAQMTHFAFGVGSGVSAAKGIVYAAGDDRTVNAFNATSGKLLWRFRTNNHNFGQPLVTANAVLVAGGNVGLNLGNYGSFVKQSANTRLGSGFNYVYALDPLTGNEKWTFYAGQGSMSMTPLYYNGVLYWVDGQGWVWAINADTGAPVAPIMDANGNPTLSVGGGFNALASPNIYQDPSGRALMVVGLSMPNRVVAIDLGLAQVAWNQPFSGVASFVTGYSGASLAVDATTGLVLGSVVVDADMLLNSAHIQVFALDGATGNRVWTQNLDAGAVPSGFVAPTPMLSGGRVYLANPLVAQVVALDMLGGSLVWKTAVTASAGLYAWGPGCLVSGGKLIQPVGGDLYTFNASTGAVLKRYTVGGAFSYNHPTVLGGTLYIGNSFGWVLGIPLTDVAGI